MPYARLTEVVLGLEEHDGQPVWVPAGTPFEIIADNSGSIDGQTEDRTWLPELSPTQYEEIVPR
jgi:hypothetical protein